MLKGKTAVITGGSRGLGRATAIKFASLGADVAIIFSGSEEAARNVCGECRAYGVRASAYQCDVADFEKTDAAAESSQIVERSSYPFAVSVLFSVFDSKSYLGVFGGAAYEGDEPDPEYSSRTSHNDSGRHSYDVGSSDRGSQR